MRARIVSVTVLAALLTAPGWAQETKTDTKKDTTINNTDKAAECGLLEKADIPSGESTPFDVEVGTEALVVKGSDLLWNSGGDIDAGWTPYVDYKLNGQFSYADDKDRVADLGVELATIKLVEDDFDPFGSCELGEGRTGFDLIPFAEARGRFADIAKNDDADWKGVLIGGLGTKVVFQIPALMALKGITGADVENPMLALTYYNAFVDNDTKNPAASDKTIAIDQIQLAFTAEIPLSIATDRAAGRKFIRDFKAFLCDPTKPCPKRPAFPYSISVDLKAGKPMKGDDRDIEFHADIALKMMQPDKKIGFVIRYRTGEDLGFEYDKQLLAGLVYRLFE
ncbi:MAG TPA: hypothetical protein VJZ00_21735 [Thermoanaerobaculia bacterium]|nr:hypothetical protein [Thermoanaerobaculia bacterium]